MDIFMNVAIEEARYGLQEGEIPNISILSVYNFWHNPTPSDLNWHITSSESSWVVNERKT